MGRGAARKASRWFAIVGHYRTGRIFSEALRLEPSIHERISCYESPMKGFIIIENSYYHAEFEK